MNIFVTLVVEPLANGLIIFYNILGSNLGLAIIAFTLFLKFMLNPLTKPYMESMKKMKEYAPQLEKLKKKHKGDKAKFAQAQSDFYKEKGISPAAGCLPYILQFVILIGFFNVFTRTLYPGVDTTEGFNSLLYGPLKFAAGETVNTQFLWFDLTQPNVVNLPFLPFPIPGILLILASIAQFVSAKIMQPVLDLEEKVAKKTEQKSDDVQATMQKSMVYTFPLFTLVIGLRFPSALAIYWLTFSIVQAYQQYKSAGWGGMTPLIRRVGLLQLGTGESKKGKRKLTSGKGSTGKNKKNGKKKK